MAKEKFNIPPGEDMEARRNNQNSQNYNQNSSNRDHSPRRKYQSNTFREPYNGQRKPQQSYNQRPILRNYPYQTQKPFIHHKYPPQYNPHKYLQMNHL